MEIPVDVQRYVERLQVHAIRERGFAPDPERYGYASGVVFADLCADAPRGDARVAADLEATRRLMVQLGPFQNPSYLYALVAHNREVLETARDMGTADDTWVPFASTTLGHHNAETRRLPSNAYVTVYDDGVFTLAELMGCQISYAWDAIMTVLDRFDSVASAAGHVFAPGSAILASIVETLASYAATQDARTAIPRIPEEFLVRDGFAGNIRSSYLRYVVAHELGHVYLRHLERAAMERTSGDADALSFDWSCEFDADTFAATVSIEFLMPKTSGFLACLMAEMAPMIGVLVDFARDYLEHGGIPLRPDNVGTHPPADRRLLNARQAIDSRIASAHPDVDVEQVHLAHGWIELMAWSVLPPLRDECLARRAR
ncbi:hypothetical protein DQ239_10905 [Blastococcus sp. TF02-09]|uniref:ImmA/IrrE family metallo-endopeptidase n=1 Tax=Blastococcus sp. TF02-09 TaxID=2250576 RepID=UPI000DEBB015|nr:hypothetical protein [Blastococcus sp. TF02-9]RBY77389.1 hypothetical protein DQ239_10905 [Blastococcus sp. TF02-9]